MINLRFDTNLLGSYLQQTTLQRIQTNQTEMIVYCLGYFFYPPEEYSRRESENKNTTLQFQGKQENKQRTQKKNNPQHIRESWYSLHLLQPSALEIHQKKDDVPLLLVNPFLKPYLVVPRWSKQPNRSHSPSPILSLPWNFLSYLSYNMYNELGV